MGVEKIEETLDELKDEDPASEASEEPKQERRELQDAVMEDIAGGRPDIHQPPQRC